MSTSLWITVLGHGLKIETQPQHRGTCVVRKERAASFLECPTRQPNRNVRIFAEEMTRLFHHAGSDMPDEKKVRFLMTAVKQDLYAELIRNTLKTVAELSSEATAIEKTVEMRTKQYDRQTGAPKY